MLRFARHLRATCWSVRVDPCEGHAACHVQPAWTTAKNRDGHWRALCVRRTLRAATTVTRMGGDPALYGGSVAHRSGRAIGRDPSAREGAARTVC